MQNTGIAIWQHAGKGDVWRWRVFVVLYEAATTYSLVHPWSHVLRICQGRNVHLTRIPGVGVDCGILMSLVLRVLLVSLVLLDVLVLLDPL